MITVSKRQLEQVQYLIEQSIQGNHVLFDVENVRRILRRNLDSDMAGVESLIEKMILEPTIERKRAFLESLDRRTYERVVRTYFNIVENNLLESKGALH